MSNTKTTPPTFLTETAPWIRGRKIAVYLRGRPKPWTGLTVKHVGRRCIVARWNSSTHIIPLSAIDGIRFAPDNDPTRVTTHPLHHTVNDRQPVPPNDAPPKPYDIPGICSDLAQRFTRETT